MNPGELVDMKAKLRYGVRSQPCGHQNDRRIISRCTANSPGAGTISYEASGPATGPYPGTFTENGTFTVASGGEIKSFTAEFTIDSPIRCHRYQVRKEHWWRGGVRQ